VAYGSQEGVAELEGVLSGHLRMASYVTAVLFGAPPRGAHLRCGRCDSARAVIDKMRPLAESMRTYVFEPELLRVEAGGLRDGGREADARRLLLRATEKARSQGSWALAVRAAVSLAGKASVDHGADLELLSDLCSHLPPDNDTDYGREANALLDRAVVMPTS
jgi:hypothetical protein